jgi:phage FluMu protein Com
MKKLQFVKIKCQCGHVNLIPVTEVFHVYENIKCEKCGKVIAEPNELIRMVRLKSLEKNKWEYDHEVITKIGSISEILNERQRRMGSFHYYII